MGTSHAASDCCVAYSQQAQALGAKAVLVAPPKLARPNDAALRRHYLTVAEAIHIPVVVQDHPASSSVFMSVEFIAALAEEAPQCRFLKLEIEPSPPKVSKVLAANPNGGHSRPPFDFLAQHPLQGDGQLFFIPNSVMKHKLLRFSRIPLLDGV